MKVIVIKEAQYISPIKMDGIIGSLLTFEMDIKYKVEKKSKGVAFKADVEEDKKKEIKGIDWNLSSSIALLEKGFGKVMRRLDKRSRNNVVTNVKGKVPENSRGFNSQHKSNDGDNQSKVK